MFMYIYKHICVWFWTSYDRLNQQLDTLIFMFNFHKFRSFRQRMNIMLYIRQFAYKQKLQGLSVREHKMKQASKQNALQHNAFEDIQVAVQAGRISASAWMPILKGKSAGCRLWQHCFQNYELQGKDLTYFTVHDIRHSSFHIPCIQLYMPRV